MLDQLSGHFSESFEYIDAGMTDKCIEEATRYYNMMVELVGKEDTIKEIRTIVDNEGWTVSDLRIINNVVGEEVFNV